MINWTLLLDSFPDLWRGAMVNIQIAIGACLIGMMGAIPLALMEQSSNQFMRGISILYTTLFRGTPMIVQIMTAYYVLPQAGIKILPLISVILAIGLNSAAYLSQVIRSGLQAVSSAQHHASRVLGMTRWQTYRYIIFPQCFRKILPALGNEGITLLKDSSLASVVGIMEIVKIGSIIRGRTFEAFTVLLGVSLVYLVLVAAFSGMVKYFETLGRKTCSV